MNSGYDTILVKDCKKLIVKIFVIGYSERGESMTRGYNEYMFFTKIYSN